MLLSEAVGRGYQGVHTKLNGLQPRGVLMAASRADQPDLIINSLPINSTMTEIFLLTPASGKSFVVNFMALSSISAVDGNLSFEIWIDGVKVLEQPPTALVTTGGVILGGDARVWSYSDLLIEQSMSVRAAKTSTAGTLTLSVNYIQV